MARRSISNVQSHAAGNHNFDSCDFRQRTLILKKRFQYQPAPRKIVLHKINVAEKFSKISDYYKPHIAGELNGQMVKLVKANTEFVWHHHDREDEMFLVVKGRFRMDFKDADAREHQEWIETGEFIIVPRGVEHRPVAEEECWIMLFEPASTLNTGNVINERTQPHLERV